MNYQELLNELKPFDATLVAVSKTKPIDQILELHEKGQRIFGENRAQELAQKQTQLPSDIEWHMIGHLQRNKVKYIAPFVSMIQSVDSPRLLKEINKQAKKHNRQIPVLLEFHIARESSKAGFTFEEANGLLSGDAIQNYQHIDIQGVMGMATFTTDQAIVRPEFQDLTDIFNQLKSAYFSEKESFRFISMGMSGDYQIALEEGSNMVRIGSLIFGPRG